MTDAIYQFGGLAVFGLIFTMTGFRVLGTPPGKSPASDAWHWKWGKFYRVIGPVLILVGAVGLLVKWLGQH